jgi:hypothetical protein
MHALSAVLGQRADDAAGNSFQASNCQTERSGAWGPAQKYGPDLNLVEEKATSDDGREIRFQYSFGSEFPSEFSFKAGKPEQIGSMKVWRAKPEITFRELPENVRYQPDPETGKWGYKRFPGFATIDPKDVKIREVRKEVSATEYTYVEVAGSPKRKVFIMDEEEPRRLPAQKDGKVITVRTIHAIDSYGNFAKLNTRTDDAVPPTTYFFNRHRCSPSPKGDGFGFPNSNDGYAQDPVIPPTIDSKEIPIEKDKQGVLRPLSEKAVRLEFAKRILSKEDDLSPRLRKFAKSLQEDTYREDPLWQLRAIILGDK